MKIAFFDSHQFEKDELMKSNQIHQFDMTFYDACLNEKTAPLGSGFECICAFVNDKLNRPVLTTLKQGGTKLIALRSAGFNHVDLIAARELGLKVVRVPEYSPYAIAEHAVGLILNLNRKIHKAYNRVREGNFSLEGLVGFDLHGKTVGVIGTGKIGRIFANIMRGFGCHVLLYDIVPDPEFAEKCGALYVSFDELLGKSDIISLHLPLTTQNKHLFNEERFKKMRPGAMLINTSRGALIDSKALVNVLKSGELGSAGLDVYEEEEHFFFVDHSTDILSDDILMRLLTFPNVIVTGHQGFLTQEAIHNIADTTLQNIADFKDKKFLKNEVGPS